MAVVRLDVWNAVLSYVYCHPRIVNHSHLQVAGCTAKNIFLFSVTITLLVSLLSHDKLWHFLSFTIPLSLYLHLSLLHTLPQNWCTFHCACKKKKSCLLIWSVVEACFCLSVKQVIVLWFFKQLTTLKNIKSKLLDIKNCKKKCNCHI